MKLHSQPCRRTGKETRVRPGWREWRQGWRDYWQAAGCRPGEPPARRSPAQEENNKASPPCTTLPGWRVPWAPPRGRWSWRPGRGRGWHPPPRCRAPPECTNGAGAGAGAGSINHLIAVRVAEGGLVVYLLRPDGGHHPGQGGGLLPAGALQLPCVGGAGEGERGRGVRGVEVVGILQCTVHYTVLGPWLTGQHLEILLSCSQCTLLQYTQPSVSIVRHLVVILLVLGAVLSAALLHDLCNVCTI
jgi:hypothetical protein